VHTVTLAWPRIPEAPEEGGEDISKDFLSNVAVRVESPPYYRTRLTDVKTKVRCWRPATDCRNNLVLRARAQSGAGLATLQAAILILVIGLHDAPARAAEPSRPPTAAAAPVTDLADDVVGAAPEVWDPIELVNRRTLDVNMKIDRWFVDPITRAYAFVVPNPARQAVRRFLINLDSPAVLANDLLQLAPLDAAVTITRFGFNSTVGLAGLFDPADAIGLTGHTTDFGQTMALYGVPSGPYLMLPVLGPTTARDGSGYVVDFLFQPTTYVLPGITLFVYASIHEGSAGLAAREAGAEGLRALEASSVDFYAALRSAYYQDRTAAIEARSDRGPRAVAERALRMFSLSSAGGKVGDLSAQPGGQRGEAVALER
jgi:phospholipid-binding lipoprotein MlaA